MKAIFDLSNIKRYTKPVVALGVFDGVHRAHRCILQGVVKKAKKVRGASIAVTFWPHPQKEGNLYSLKHRLRLIAQLGIGVCIVIRFNKAFSRISAEDFIRDILIKKLNARYVYVGKNFRFGNRAKGNIKLLKRLSGAYNFKLKVFNVINIDHRPVSSTYIRKLIIKGDLKAAQKLLSRPVSVLGTVIKGSSLAKRLGFPTANINPHHEVIPPAGVYAVKVVWNNKIFPAVSYIGSRPTFSTRKKEYERQPQKNVEVHIFGFKKNIYGQDLEIQFLDKIRKEEKFASQAHLVKQVEQDILLTKRLFFPPPPRTTTCAHPFA